MKLISNDFLRNRIKAWGFDLTPKNFRSNKIIEDLYQPAHIEIIELLDWYEKKEKSYANISLFVLNNRWSYCLSIHTQKHGMGYGPFFKFCKPYPSRCLALHAACTEIYQKTRNKKLIKWAKNLQKVKQLKLF